ncbi:hypothetical protein DB895_00720 [Flavobacterium psychrotolerans]|uniref:Uncharacterized protein n=1 Tax=Flavobacterium psychrotolerans TaxID=2169410 RepID=A0A2U1JQ24_9FLAO|nr:hypothetical protein DB895_00720 [Flavobacterium psychrotolerans]
MCLALLNSSVCFFGFREFHFVPFHKPYIKFLKEKKKKKKVVLQVEVSRKTSFFRKNTTRYIIGNVGVKSE